MGSDWILLLHRRSHFRFFRCWKANGSMETIGLYPRSRCSKTLKSSEIKSFFTTGKLQESKPKPFRFGYSFGISLGMKSISVDSENHTTVVADFCKDEPEKECHWVSKDLDRLT